MLFMSSLIKKFKNNIINIIYGFLIGASILIPGLSGGTTAIIIGIYNKILQSLEDILFDFKENFVYLFTLTLGAIIGFITCSYPLSYILNCYPVQVSYLVIGVILGSVPMFLSLSKENIIHNSSFIVLGGTFIILLDIVTNNVLIENDSTIILLIVAIFSSVALILPGISFSNILLAFGYYEVLITSIKTMNIAFILKFSLALFIATLMFAKLLNKIYKKYPIPVNMLVLGMILASVKQVYISLPTKEESLQCFVLFVLGITISVFMVFIKKRTDSA